MKLQGWITQGCGERLAGGRRLEVEGVADDSRGVAEEGMAEESTATGPTTTMSTILKWT
jgi:hypothetical protein